MWKKIVLGMMVYFNFLVVISLIGLYSYAFLEASWPLLILLSVTLPFQIIMIVLLLIFIIRLLMIKASVEKIKFLETKTWVLLLQNIGCILAAIITLVIANYI